MPYQDVIYMTICYGHVSLDHCAALQCEHLCLTNNVSAVCRCSEGYVTDETTPNKCVGRAIGYIDYAGYFLYNDDLQLKHFLLAIIKVWIVFG